MYSSNFTKFYIIIECYEDIDGLHACFQNDSNDYFHLFLAIIVFKIKYSLFPAVWNKQIDYHFLNWQISSLVYLLINCVTLLLSHESLRVRMVGILNKVSTF